MVGSRVVFLGGVMISLTKCIALFRSRVASLVIATPRRGASE